MESISSALSGVLTGRIVFLGVGNPERGDDGFGIQLAQSLRNAGLENVFIAGTTPEDHVIALRNGHYDAVIFLDAVFSDTDPGSVILMDASGIKSAFPQVSTHKMSLETLAEIICSGNGTKAWLLGVRPVSIVTGAGLSETTERTLRLLAELIIEARRGTQKDPERERPCI